MSTTTAITLPRTTVWRESGSQFELSQIPSSYQPQYFPSNNRPGTIKEESILELRDTLVEGPTKTNARDDIENSRPSSPSPGASVTYALQTLSSPSINKLRLLCVCLLNFTNGLNDSAPGALLPSIERSYGVNYATVSTIFLANACGYLTTAFLSHYIYEKLGRAKTIALSAVSMCLGSSILIAHPRNQFAAIPVGFFFMGAGMSLNSAQGNVFCTGLANSGTMLGYSHGSYGVGGTIGPLIATALVSRGVGWNYYYFTILGLCVFNLALCMYAFRHSESELITDERLHRPDGAISSNAVTTSGRVSGRLKEALKSKVTLITAFFIFCYCGAEVSIGGWIVTFLVTARKGNPEDVGYVASGFWLGITIGRFLLSYPCSRIGERRAVFILLAGAVLFEILVWSVPNIVSNAVSFALVGLLLGPIYPCTMNVVTRTLSRSLHVPSLSFIAAFGAGGGAVSPFATGLLAQMKGAFVLNPVAISLFCAMEGSWLILARMSTKIE